MPAKDKYHDAVVSALEKEGWSVESQILLRLGKRRVWIDARAEQNEGNSIIMIEIKGFERMDSPVDYLANVVGQYVLYSVILEILSDFSPLYLTVPIHAHQGILSEPIGQAVIERVKIKLIVFNPITEEIVEWIEWRQQFTM